MNTRQSSTRRRYLLNDRRLEVPTDPMTPDQIRAAASPPIPPDHQLWRDGDGGPDKQIKSDHAIKIRPGDVFFSEGPDGAHPRSLVVFINDVSAVAPAVSLTGEQIRALAQPPIPADHRLFRDVDGSRDEVITDNEIVTIRHGSEFYSTSPFFIIVNGREKTRDDLDDRDLTFEEVVQLAFDSPPTGAQVMFSVTYRHGSPQHPTGTLVAGQSIKARKGMHFNVTATDKS